MVALLLRLLSRCGSGYLIGILSASLLVDAGQEFRHIPGGEQALTEGLVHQHDHQPGEDLQVGVSPVLGGAAIIKKRVEGWPSGAS